ncbi:MAG TPA: MBOAT family O-acyltransferase [Planctomycetota bacterium]|nr:MBOAT family O-acyltransferase [Planctomycetota bacterium]
MLFNSPEYLALFIAAMLAGWLGVGWPRLRIVTLALLSFYFYAANNSWLILLLLASTQVDFMVGRALTRTDDPVRRRRLLWVSLVANLGLLGFFKYFNFFVGSAVDLARMAGFEIGWTPWQIALPVGISFYTFQTLSYTIDVYRGDLPAAKSWWDFSFFVAFFPQLVAGPIVRAADFLPQVPRRPTLSAEELTSGLHLIMRGLVKKIVLADFLGGLADHAFNAPSATGALGAWVGLYAFTFQIYLDFSGYSDIAIGCARLLGYHLPDNFNLPYAASSFSDFWRRWHISLSTWLRDYLYIPLGGNRMPTAAGVYRNLMITMLLGGLWHGAAWHFVLWGLAHGCYLAFERRFGAGRLRASTTGLRAGLLRRLFVFHAVVFTWLLFRVQTTSDLVAYLHALVGLTDVVTLPTRAHAVALLLCAAAWAAQQFGLRGHLDGWILRLPVWVQAIGHAGAMVAVLVFNSRGAQPFLYFQF